MLLDELNAVDDDVAVRALVQCCGSTRWARLMTAARPFATADDVADAADRIWTSLDHSDWLEAFAAHPRIGAAVAGAVCETGGAGCWESEQAGMASAAQDVRDRLAASNREYEARFGYIFIVCATGKTAAAMLDILDRRLPNAPDVELTIAAGEQHKITRLRLATLLAPEQRRTT